MKGQGFGCEAVEESEILDSECRNNEIKIHVEVGWCRGGKKNYVQADCRGFACLTNTCFLMPDILHLQRQALRTSNKFPTKFEGRALFALLNQELKARALIINFWVFWCCMSLVLQQFTPIKQLSKPRIREKGLVAPNFYFRAMFPVFSVS